MERDGAAEGRVGEEVEVNRGGLSRAYVYRVISASLP